MNHNNEVRPRKPLRLWPGVALAVVVLLGRYVLPAIAPDAEIFGLSLGIVGVFAGMFGALAIALWWLFFSRAAWIERIGAIVLTIAGVLALRPLVHESIRGGMMGAMPVIYSVPVLSVALVIWAAATHHLADRLRRTSLVLTVVLACVPFLLIRTAGVWGAGGEFHWRWTPTPEERLLAEATDEPVGPAPAPPPHGAPAPAPPEAPDKRSAPAADEKAAPRPGSTRADGDEQSRAAAAALADEEPAARTAPPAEWPGFRGHERDGVVRGVRINTDWEQSPPVEIWRRPIGPGWSSFSVRGDLLYTQEQRGEEEMVSCYRVSTGQPVWRHRDSVRFWESNGGPGPRATPTIHGNRVYAFGATGILNALDAATGQLVWSRNVASDTGRRVPDWGFASSPLVVNDIVVVAASGTLAAYDLETGTPRWRGPSYGGSYSSPHRVTLDGVEQILLLGGPGAISVAPADGRVLWLHEWSPGPIVQPAVTQDGDILINAIVATGGIGTRRLRVTHEDGRWRVEERWTSNGLKPYFNDFVVHKGHAFGFDGSILSSINLEDGRRNWKGGRYGNGQLVLLAEQDLLLVISEDGELALVSATPDGYRELARVPALNAKTWNHPVIVGHVLLIRNGEEMAAFRLPLLDGAEVTSR